MKKRLVLLLVLVSSIFVLTGCINKNMFGEYNIYEIKSSEKGVKGVSSKEKKKYKFDYYLKVNEDKTALLKIDGEETKLKFDEKYFYIVNDKSDKVSYTFDGKELTLNIEKAKLVFRKK